MSDVIVFHTRYLSRVSDMYQVYTRDLNRRAGQYTWLYVSLRHANSISDNFRTEFEYDVYDCGPPTRETLIKDGYS